MARWISCSVAGEILDVDPATVRGWARRRLDGKASKLRYVRLIGSRYYVSKREIRTLLRRLKALTKFQD